MTPIMDAKRRFVTRLVAASALIGAAVAVVMALPGDLLFPVAEPEPMSSCCGIGVEFLPDGRVAYTHYTDNRVLFTDLSGANLGALPLVNPDLSPFGGDAPNAIAYNAVDGKLYAGGWGSTNLYQIDLTTGVTTLHKANALAGYTSFNFIDGLAWDPRDNTFWMSDDVSCHVRHLDAAGTDIGGFDGCAVTGLSNSGLTVSLDGTLYYGTNGAGQIFALDTTTSPPTNLGQFASPGGRDEDMSCGPPYTKADGSVVDTLLSQDAYGNFFHVIEMEPGKCTPPFEEPKEEHGRMTGGGRIVTAAGRVTHGFELHCTPSDGSNNLQVNWGGNRFHLESLTSASCTEDPSIAPHPPTAGFDTYKGTGTGRYNGQSGASAEWTFTDAGEPGKSDTMTIEIKDSNNVLVLTATGTLDVGNHQAHKQ